MSRRLLPLALLALPIAALCAADPWERLTEAAAAPPDQARQQLEALLLERPGFHAAHYDLGTLLLATDPEAAAEHLQAATAASDATLAADAWHNLALARLAQGRLDEALVAAVRAAELNPQLADDRDRLRAAVLVAKDEARRRAEEEAKKLRIPRADLPRAAVGQAYEARIPAAGGAGGYLFAVAGKTTLPKGLTLELDGRLHGTPTTPERAELSLTVTDSAKASAIGTVTLTIVPPPAITTEALPEAILSQPYRAELASSGLTDPRWSAAGLPAGLALETAPGAKGALAGTPTVAGEFDVEITARDDRFAASRAYHLVVSDSFAPDVAELPPATAWAQYQHRVGVRGPAQEYRWQLAEPVAGMTLAPDGTLAGSPEHDGRLEVPVTIAAADGRSRRFTLALPVNPPPVIDEEGSIQLTQGQPVERPLKAHGGTPPPSWSIADGTLPAGLRLDPDGTLRGATTTTGTSEATVALADHWQASTQKRLTFKVDEAKKQDDQKDQQKKQDDQQKDDEKKQDQQQGDQRKDQQAKDDQQKQQPPDDQKQDQAKQDQQKQDQQKSGQTGKDQRKPDQQASSQRQAADQKQDEQPGAKGETAAARWLESLPKEDRDALRGQLLRRAAPPPRKGDPW